MNRITLAAAIGFGLLSLTGCQVRQYIPSVPAPAVGAPGTPSTCEGSCYTPPPPNTTLPTPTCPEGLTWSPTVHSCFGPPPPTTTTVPPTCPDGFTWNPTIHSCY